MSGPNPVELRHDKSDRAMRRQVPERMEGESGQRCTHCRTRNDAERRFCGECGAPLHGPCPQCGESVGLAEKYCGGCGLHVAAVFEARLQGTQALLQEAAALRRAAQFKQARHVLQRVAVDDDPLLFLLRRLATEELARCAEEQLDAENRRRQLFEMACAAMERHDYDLAASYLEQVPEGVRTSEVQQLAERAAAFRHEVDQLVRAIRSGIAGQQYAGLSAKVARLLVLKPSHEQARGMVAKLRALDHRQQSEHRDCLLDAARAHVAACRYSEAVELLEGVAPAMRTPDVDRMLAVAHEAAYLSQQLRTATVATDCLVRLGERLVKLQPRDQSALKLVEQLRKRRAAASTPAVMIRPVPSHTAIGPAVELPAPWTRIRVDAAAEATLRERGAQFHAAAGLALGGLGKAMLRPNLRGNSDGSLWRRLAKAVRQRDSRVAWGIDIGDYSLKALRLRIGTGDEVLADAAEYLEYERPLHWPGVDIAATLAAASQRLTAKHDVLADPLCVSIPGQSLLSRSFLLPPVDVKRIPDLMKYEVAQQIPVPVDQVAWDYHVFDSTDPDSRYDREAALFAVKRKVLRERLGQLEAIGLRPDQLQADCLAIYNLFAFEGALPNGRPATATSREEDVAMVLDIGGEATNVIVGHDRTVWTRLMPVGGHQFTSILAKELKLTNTDAERFKRQPYAAKSAYEIDRVLHAVFEDLVAEVVRSMTFYAGHQRRRRVARIIPLGGGALQHGLLEALSAGR